MDITQAAQEARAPVQNVYVGHRCVSRPEAELVRITLTWPSPFEGEGTSGGRESEVHALDSL
jgi:hypothetical protein